MSRNRLGNDLSNFWAISWDCVAYDASQDRLAAKTDDEQWADAWQAQRLAGRASPPPGYVEYVSARCGELYAKLKRDMDSAEGRAEAAASAEAAAKTASRTPSEVSDDDDDDDDHPRCTRS